MPCTEHGSRSGMSLVEVMISMAIFGLLGAALWGNVFLHGQSYVYNLASNENSREAGFVVNRLVYGNQALWGLRTASRARTSVDFTGLVGAEGALGWSARVRHGIESADRPALYDTEEQVVTYDPVARTIDVNGTVVGEDVVDAYFQLSGGDILLGVRVESETGGRATLMETRIRMRNG